MAAVIEERTGQAVRNNAVREDYCRHTRRQYEKARISFCILFGSVGCRLWAGRYDGDTTMTDSTYNGWSNHATWRINLEIFSDGVEHLYDSGHGLTSDDVDAEWAVDYAEEIIFGHCDTDGIVESYARAFMQCVNWYEIASHIAEELKELEENEDD